jgi:hypothetical protein
MPTLSATTRKCTLRVGIVSGFRRWGQWLRRSLRRFAPLGRIGNEDVFFHEPGFLPLAERLQGNASRFAGVSMRMQTAAYYRQRAERVRQLARLSSDSVYDELMQLAQDFEDIADDLRKHPPRTAAGR